MIRRPTDRQIAAAKKLGIEYEGMSFRVISAHIGDELDRRADDHVRNHGLKPGMKVKYTGARLDMPGILVISTYGRNCFLYFKGGISAYCRPWDVVPVQSKKSKANTPA